MLVQSLERFEKDEVSMKEALKVLAASDLETMSSSTFQVIQSMLRFMDASTELIKEQTMVLNSMNEKLNSLANKGRA